MDRELTEGSCEEQLKQAVIHPPTDSIDQHCGSALENATEIAVDCEMDSTGCLSLVQIACNLEVFIFDMKNKTRDSELVVVLKSVFENPNVIKIFFDCRYDAFCLKRQYGILLTSVCDCQVVAMEEKTPDRSPAFFRKCFEKGSYSWNSLFSPSFATTVEKQLPYFPPEWKTFKNSPKRSAGWDKRPLPQEYVTYAAHDVLLLSLLWQKVKVGRDISYLAATSLRYMNLQPDMTPGDSVYKSNCIFPFTIFTVERTKKCKFCECNVGISFFPTSLKNKNRNRCFRCNLSEKIEQRNYDRERRNDDYDDDDDDYYYYR